MTTMLTIMLMIGVNEDDGAEDDTLALTSTCPSLGPASPHCSGSWSSQNHQAQKDSCRGQPPCHVDFFAQLN